MPPKPIVNIIYNDERMNMLSLRLGIRWECLLLPVLFQYSTEKYNH